MWFYNSPAVASSFNIVGSRLPVWWEQTRQGEKESASKMKDASSKGSLSDGFIAVVVFSQGKKTVIRTANISFSHMIVLRRQ